MGSGTSKSSPQSSQHVFASETPVRFSQELVDSLQASTETDSTREKTLELHIQSRVAEELQRLEARESQILKDLEEKISSTSDSTTDSTHTPSTTTPDQSQSHGGKDHSAKAAGDKLRNLGRESIQKEIDELRNKLNGRKKLGPLDKGVEKAKEDVVKCLRMNDRRPLDCWREVEAFKREVRRLEKSFVDRVIS
ncbi:MAG: hypothetical protein M1830_004718 [Pleopsidium flavum]|nr:MAG: hypothetical protein M1830_004731 [Pleopsidium flavum]KAI9870070.1 MAG: hypothetical protein M1830_004718 [Pleopsidium flavum]